MKRKEYTFTLVTLAPVHIGSGEEATNKEYIYENNTFYFPDMGKLYQEITQYGEETVDAFETFLMSSGNGERLINFLKNNNITSRNFGGYHIKSTGYENAENEQVGTTDENKIGQINEIHKFIKDPYGNPYIPGSSLKGALRTILVNQVFKKDNNRNNRQAIHWGSRSREKFDDVFHNIRVGDSDSISTDRLMLAQKTDFSKEKNKDTVFPLTRESIKPITTITFKISAIGEEAIKLIDNLPDLAKKHYNEYANFFLNDFPVNFKQNNYFAPIYLGGGSGLWTKTLLSEYNNIMNNVYNRAPRRMKMEGKGTLKLTRSIKTGFTIKGNDYRLIDNNFNFYEMGKCMFDIKEIEGVEIL